MGFAVGYETTEKLNPELQRQVQATLSACTDGRTWLSCEPPLLHDQDGHLFGASKPSFSPHPDDVASAESENLPDGTLMDLLDALCQVSREHGVDWNISHDFGHMGYIRDGVCEAEVREQCEALCEAADMLGGEFDLGDF